MLCLGSAFSISAGMMVLNIDGDIRKAAANLDKHYGSNDNHAHIAKVVRWGAVHICLSIGLACVWKWL